MRSRLQNLADEIRETQELIEAGSLRVQELEKVYDAAQDAVRKAKVDLGQEEIALIALEGKMEELRSELRSIANAG
jgi:chromosome segregation ATPase